MKHPLATFWHLILYSLVIIGTLSSCHAVERLTTERTVRVDTVQVDVPVPGWRAVTTFAEGDSLFYEDDRIRLRIIPELANLSPDSEGQHAEWMPIDSADAEPMPNQYRVDVEVKDDTLQANVEQKTITEKREETIVQKEMPNWGWALIGGLLMLALIGIVGAKLMR